MVKELSLPYILSILGRRIVGFIPFQKILAQCEMQRVSFRIWTRFTVSISFDGNHCTMNPSITRMLNLIFQILNVTVGRTLYIIAERVRSTVAYVHDCDIVVSEFELKWSYCVHFSVNTYPLSYGLNITTIVFLNRLIGLVVRMFSNGPGDVGSIPGHVIPKTLKMVLDTSLLNTQQYKVCIKDKVGQSRETSSALPHTSV